uniref:Parathyroid hormone-related protein-like n=1 Tax=Scleropages formosus TaxID=113540 RepID=A0A8C9QQY9_SCLFO
MLSSRSFFQQWGFAIFLLCSPVPHYGKPVASLTSRTKRTVTHAQLMHDKGRALHDFKRHVWLQELLHGLHTAEDGGIASSSITSSLQPKPTGSTKTYPRGFPLQEEEEDEDEEDEEEGGGGTNLPQETDKLQTYKVPAPKTASGRKRKGRSGKRRDCDKRKPRLPSVTFTLGEEHDNWKWQNSNNLFSFNGYLLY